PELDDEAQAGDPGSEPFQEPHGGGGGAPGGQYVVDDEDLLIHLHGVAVELQQPRPVLELVGLGLDLPRQLADLADGHETGAEAVGHWRGDDEAPGLDTDDLADPAPHIGLRDAVDDEGEALGVGEERRYVLE